MSDDLEAILAAREARYQKQAALAGAGSGIAVTVNLNLPGGSDRYPWSASALDEAGMAVARMAAVEGWDFDVVEEAADAAGPYVVGIVRSGSADPGRLMQVKQALALLEEGHPRGRLWDIDVLDQDGRPLSRAETGQAPRRCYVCSAPAHECRVLRRHSLEETGLAAERIYLGPVVDEVLAGATAGMLLEAATWPSPGLVSPFDSGAHDDMNYLTFVLSASSISPRLFRLVERARDFTLGRKKDEDLPDLFRQARAAGVHVEDAMLTATSGANTHRGTIFALGMTSVAAMVVWGRMTLLGSRDRPSAAAICDVVKDMTRGLVARELESLRGYRSAASPGGGLASGGGIAPGSSGLASGGGTAPGSGRAPGDGLGSGSGRLSRGQRLYLDTGCTGIRGEVERGLPTVRDVGLPALDLGLERAGLAGALTHSLISIMSVADDSALAGRHSLNILREFVWTRAREALYAGSVFTEAGRNKIRLMQQVFAERRLNPGGSGDLLAVTVAMYCWSHGAFTRERVLQAIRW
ncbi:MAG: triphosphoribosyl-dephospho-CoA synthase [Bacillota bacterium]|nr:triphosphoribosyl-dephospho-CoA synthase [Bacillota bacterium]